MKAGSYAVSHAAGVDQIRRGEDSGGAHGLRGGKPFARIIAEAGSGGCEWSTVVQILISVDCAGVGSHVDGSCAPRASGRLYFKSCDVLPLHARVAFVKQRVVSRFSDGLAAGESVRGPGGARGAPCVFKARAVEISGIPSIKFGGGADPRINISQILKGRESIKGNAVAPNFDGKAIVDGVADMESSKLDLPIGAGHGLERSSGGIAKIIRELNPRFAFLAQGKSGSINGAMAPISRVAWAIFGADGFGSVIVILQFARDH